MFLVNPYVPFLKGRLGEFRALKSLSPEVRSGLTPLVDVQRRERGPQWLVNNITSHWGPLRPLFLDFRYLDGSENNGEHPVVETARLASEADLRLIFTLGRERPENYLGAVTAARSMCHCQIGVRLTTTCMSDLAFLTGGIETLLKRAGTSPTFSHLILDFGYVLAAEVPARAALAIRALGNIPNLASYASVTVAATGFPFNLMGLAKDDHVARTEVDLWDRVAASDVGRIPFFGDYGVANPEVDDEIDPRKMNPCPSIRYTAERQWIILKRRSVRSRSPRRRGEVRTTKRDYTPFRQVCKDLMVRPEFCGKSFSTGDSEIPLRASGTMGPGNPMVWRQIGTSHHLSYVVLKEATHFAPPVR